MGKIVDSIYSIFNDQKELGIINQRELACRVGHSQSFVSQMLSGDRRMSAEMVEKFCDALGISLCDLEKPLPTNAEPKELREYSAKLKHLYEVSKVPGFRNVSRAIDDWLESIEARAVPKPKEPAETVSEPAPEPAPIVPFPDRQQTRPIRNIDAPQPAQFVQVRFFERIPAGDPQQLSFDPSMWIDILHSSKKPGWYALRVSGDSMLPDYMDGDIILMDYSQAPNNGDIVAALIDGSDSTLKVFSRNDDEITLTPMNKKKYKPKEYHASQVTIQGVLVELVRRAPRRKR